MTATPTIKAEAYSTLSYKERADLRKRYAEAQNGECAYCGTLLSCNPAAWILADDINWSLFPPAFLVHSVHLHHDHTTDLTIGAVHARCNAHSWYYKGV